MINLISLITGIFWGMSIGLGFYPVWKQPKNIKIQLALSFFGALGMAYILLHLK
jgi:hypothetical protein